MDFFFFLEVFVISFLLLFLTVEEGFLSMILLCSYGLVATYVHKRQALLVELALEREDVAATKPIGEMIERRYYVHQ